MHRRVCVIGIGNTFMGDDGVGVRVAEELASRGPGVGAEIVLGGLGGMQLAPHLLASDYVIFLDAIDAGDEPGSVFRFRAEDGLPSLRSHTSHGISVPELLFAARLSGSQAEVVVYAIQVGSVSLTADALTPPVAEAAAEVAEMVLAEIASVRDGSVPEA